MYIIPFENGQQEHRSPRREAGEAGRILRPARRHREIEGADIIKKRFRGKVVYCNCDDPRVSNFFHCFSRRFEALGLKKPIAACCKSRNPNLCSRNDSEQAIRLEYEGGKDGDKAPDPEETGVFLLQGDGDFRSAECIELPRQADIVSAPTRPSPCSPNMWRNGSSTGRSSSFIGNPDAIAYKEIFPLIKENRMWIGRKSMETDMLFDAPPKCAEKLILTKRKGSGYRIINGKCPCFRILIRNKRPAFT